jgi:hypothetical protein
MELLHRRKDIVHIFARGKIDPGFFPVYSFCRVWREIFPELLACNPDISGNTA